MEFQSDEGLAECVVFQVADVNKPLMSISDRMDRRCRVMFDQDDDTGEDISFITNKVNGQAIKMRRDKNVWVVNAYIDDEAEQSFTRPVAAP